VGNIYQLRHCLKKGTPHGLGSTGRRQVLWQIAEIAAILSGPKMIELLEAAVAAAKGLS